MQSEIIPPPPALPGDEARRMEMVQGREALLGDAADDLARAFLLEKAGEDKAAILGQPDLSANPLASVCRQLSTPGLYGATPDLLHQDPEAAAVLRAQADASGWLSKMQRIQYLALGLGEYLARLDVPPSVGHLTVRPASPGVVCARGTPDAPDVPVEIAELRLRQYEGKWIWVWDEYSIEDEANPYYRICKADAKEGEEADLSAYYLKDGAPSGDAYPYRYADGRPFLPWVIYRAADTGKMWNHLDKRGATIGTLNTIVYSTYVGHVALGATGRTVLCQGLAPFGDVRAAPSDSSPTTRPRSVSIMPGSFVFTSPLPDATNPGAQEIGPGADLDVLSAFALSYEAQQAVRAGLNPSDATRSHANPTSGAALAISNRGRREFAEQVAPVFRRADLEAIRKIAALCRLAGVASIPETGWSIVYQPIPDSPEESKSIREDLEWRQAQGLASPADVYCQINPGVDRETAFAKLAQVAADRRRIEQEAAAAETALNGAQIASLVQIAQAVAAGTVSPPQGVAMIRASVPSIDEAAATAIAGSPIPALTAPPTPAPPAGA